MMGKWQEYSRLLVMVVAMWVSVAEAGPEQDVELADQIFLSTGDLPKTLELLRKAAQQGYAPAQVRLGYILDKADLDEEAVEWYRKAAQQGYAAGEYGLGYMYALGEGVKQDLEQARTWVQRAAEKNHLPAVVMLMEAYKAGDLGLPLDMAQSRFWEDKARAIREEEKASDPEQKKKGHIGESK